MKCPNCKIEMENGVLTQEGHAWRKGGAMSEFAKIAASFSVLDNEIVLAWRCPKCFKVELYTEAKEKNRSKIL